MPRSEGETIYIYLARYMTAYSQMMDDVRTAEKIWSSLNLSAAQKTVLKNSITNQLNSIKDEMPLMIDEINAL